MMSGKTLNSVDTINGEIEENKDFLFLFGSGGTIDHIAGKLGYKNTLLGIDAIYKNKVVGIDLNEEKILKLLEKYQKAKLRKSSRRESTFFIF